MPFSRSPMGLAQKPTRTRSLAHLRAVPGAEAAEIQLFRRCPRSLCGERSVRIRVGVHVPEQQNPGSLPAGQPHL